MTNKKYTIDAKPTMYNGIQFRSRLEAQWAAFFDFLRFEYEYEPESFTTWSPDFTVHNLRAFVEIKPFAQWDDDLINKIKPYSVEHRCGLFSDEIGFDNNGFYLGKVFSNEQGLILKDLMVPYSGWMNQKDISMMWKEARNKVMYLKPKT